MVGVQQCGVLYRGNPLQSGPVLSMPHCFNYHPFSVEEFVINSTVLCYVEAIFSYFRRCILLLLDVAGNRVPALVSNALEQTL